LKRYPTAKQAEKLELEIEKLRTQMDQGMVSDLNITIVDEWAKDGS